MNAFSRVDLFLFLEMEVREVHKLLPVVIDDIVLSGPDVITDRAHGWFVDSRHFSGG